MAKTRAKQRSANEPGFLAKQRKAKLVTRARPFSAQQRFNSFKTATKYGPIFICCCCHRRLFRQSVVQFKENIKQSILKEAPQILDRCIYTDGKIAERLLVDIGKDPQAWLCATCRIYLKQNRMPPMCSQNNLQIHDTNLRAPSELESSFIARNILYMKIGSLPVSRMSVLQGKVVNVPIRPEDQKNTLTKLNNASLPRTPNEACLVLATLKKKMTFNGHYLKQLVDIDLIFQYLDLFKTKGHPYYQDVLSPDQYQLKCAQSDPAGFAALFPDQVEHEQQQPMDTDPETSEEGDQQADCPDGDDQDEIDYQTKDPVRKHQFSYNKTVVMTDTNPEDRAVTLAPGEDQTPEHVLSSHDWDIKAFPCLNNPDGSNGLSDPTRPEKLRPGQYSEQRVLNVDQRFAKSPTYTYALVSYLEKRQISSNTNLSFTTGHQVTAADGKASFHVQDPWTVLGGIKNSPKFWRQKKADFIAKLNSYGPFQWFFSLSCAEKRWPNNFTTILRDLPDVIGIVHEVNSKTKEEVITINSRELGPIPMEDYIDQLSGKQYKLVSDNIVTTTRNFDQRLKAFIKNIVMGKDNPMNVLMYTYRVEFQRRGAPHAHGVIWMDMAKIERLIPGLTKAFTKLRHGTGIKDPALPTVTSPKLDKYLELLNDAKPLTKMIDMFTTCSLHPGTVGDDVVEIVQEVNKHCHTKTCKKRGTHCRFNYPKLPSEETVICQPYKDKEQMDKADTVLDKIRVILNNKESMQAIWDTCPDKGDSKKDYILNRRTRIQALCQQADVLYKDYKQYLKISRHGYTVVLQRDTDEVFINSYNPDWIKAWDGNLDIQPTLDFFAVITYITEYAWKPEPMETDINKALEACDDDMRDKMKLVSNTFLTTREMGESESIYKLLPNLGMTGSNNSSLWISLDKPDDKTKRMRRVPEEHQHEQQDMIQIEDRDGLWTPQWDMQDKYFRRPKSLNNMCFATFSRMYVPISRSKPDDTDNNFDEDGSAEEQLIVEAEHAEDDPFSAFKILPCCDQDCCHGGAISLPDHIKLDKPHRGELSNMKLKRIPKALRFYKSKLDKDPYKYFHQELLLYVPCGMPENGTIDDLINPGKFCTQDLHTLTNKELSDVYVHNQEHIQQVKAKVMPYLEDVEEQRFFVEEATKLLDPTKIGDQLAPTREQDNDDALNEGVQDDPDYQHIDPNNIDIPQEVKTSGYGNINIPDKKELHVRTRRLDKDQHRVVDIIITYCKDLARARINQSPVPSPPHIMVHGAAGTGKSTVIDLVTQWAQHILQKSGDNPQQPYILKCAFTGTAAANIGGNTLTSTFKLQYGNEHFSLSDKERDKTRIAMTNLKLLVIDEISLVKSDMLYQLDLKLQEIKQNLGVPFGGVMIAAFGDIFQLKPVLANYIFEKPRNPAFMSTFLLDSRWQMLQVINLETNHRQGEDGAFADLLNRVRFTKKGQLLPEDLKTLEERVRPANHPDLQGADMSIVCTLSKAQEINASYLAQLPGDTTTITAICFKPNQKDFKPQVSDKDGSIGKTGFIYKLDLKVGAKVMMIKNVNTSDCLTNGQTGVLMDMIRDKHGEVESLVVKFDREDAGREARSKDPQLAQFYPGGTKIVKERLTYTLKKGGGATATLIQFPLKLAKAVTAHKIQGLTVYQPNTINLDISSTFEAAQAYVMLGRAQALQQVHIMDKLKPNSIYASDKALIEYDKMNQRALNNQTSGWFAQQPEALKIASLNVARLQPHFEDVLCDPTLLKADIIHLCETWLIPDQDLACFKIPGYQSNFLNIGPGRGVVTFFKDTFKLVQNVAKDDYQITVFASDTLYSIHIYRSTNSSTPGLIEDLGALIPTSSPTIITGDFNICLRGYPANRLTTFLKSQGFSQINKTATHDAGGQIDHVYINDPNNSFDKPDLLRFSPYYTDHDALCTTLRPTQVNTIFKQFSNTAPIFRTPLMPSFKTQMMLSYRTSQMQSPWTILMLSPLNLSALSSVIWTFLTVTH